MPLWLLLAGAGVAAWWLLTPSSSSPSASSTLPPGNGGGYGGPVATSPAISYAASYMPNPNAPIPSGLPAGWYWEDQQNTGMILLGDSVRAFAMSPDDMPTIVYGTAMDTANDITFQITSATNPATGLSNGQELVLPASYVTLANAAV